jgi:hypothetical protein
MEGVMGEAEKEGKGDEVKKRIEEFKQQSFLKGIGTMTFFVTLFVYFKTVNPYIPPGH